MSVHVAPPVEPKTSQPPLAGPLAAGTLQVFMAEALVVPTGLATAAYLTRQLGPEGYGVLLLATTVVSWIGWSMTSAFTRTTIKFVGEAEDWQSVAATVLQLHVLLGLAAVALIWALAKPIATALGEPGMDGYLRLFILEVPLFSLAYAHRSVLVGLGKFSQRAVSVAVRWIARMVLTIGFVAAGLSIWGAIIGIVSASLIELLLCRYYIRPPLVSRTRFPMQALWGYAMPLFLLAISLRLYDKLDLLMLKLLGGTAADAGFYGTAQHLSLVPSLFTLAFVPLLLATLTRRLSAGDLAYSQRLSQDAMRLVLLMLPFAGIAAGASAELVALMFSSTFLPAAPLFAQLIFAAVAMAMITVTTCILTAASKPRWTVALAGPMVPLAVAAHWWVIPRFGAVGATWVTTTIASLGASALTMAIYHLWKIVPPVSSLGRCLLLSGFLYTLANNWMTPGWLLVVKLVVLSALIVPGLWLLGEFSAREKALMRATVPSLKYWCRTSPS